MADDHPGAHLVIRTAASEELVALLVDGKVELVLGRPLHQPGLDSALLYDERYVLVVGRDHRFATRRQIQMMDISDEVLVLFSRSASYGELLQALKRRGITPRTVIDVDNCEASKEIVREGVGITLIPYTAVAADLAQGRLREVGIAGVVPVRRSMVALMRKARPESAIRDNFLRCLRHRLGQMGLVGRGAIPLADEVGIIARRNH